MKQYHDIQDDIEALAENLGILSRENQGSRIRCSIKVGGLYDSTDSDEYELPLQPGETVIFAAFVRAYFGSFPKGPWLDVHDGEASYGYWAQGNNPAIKTLTELTVTHYDECDPLEEAIATIKTALAAWEHVK